MWNYDNYSLVPSSLISWASFLHQLEGIVNHYLYLFIALVKKFNVDRLAGAVLIAPVLNYWWAGLPANLTNEVFYQQKLQDQWTVRVAHYIPWLTYWWNTQKWFPSSSLIADSIDLLSLQDRELLPKRSDRKNHVVCIWIIEWKSCNFIIYICCWLDSYQLILIFVGDCCA